MPGEKIFWIADGERPGEGTHVAFKAETRAQVDAFHAAALQAGGRDNGAPGPRPHYGPDYYAAFVYDPDEANIEAVCYAKDSRSLEPGSACFHDRLWVGG